MRTRRPFALLAAAVLASAPAVTVASPGTFTLSAPVVASSASPFAACTAGETPDGVVYPNTEVEPFVAVNPTNLNNIIGNYQQDRWSDGGSRGLVASRSMDGGLTWAQNWAEFSVCADNPATPYLSPFNRSTDPWVSFDSAGRAYQISLGIDSVAFNLSGIEVSTSSDGGASWNLPARLITDNNPVEFNDKESITGDWRPGIGDGKAYATWIRGDLPGWPRSARRGPSTHSPTAACRCSPRRLMVAKRGPRRPPCSTATSTHRATRSSSCPTGPWSISSRSSSRDLEPNQTISIPSGRRYVRRTVVRRGGPIKIASLGTALLTNPDIPNPTVFEETVRAGDYLPDVAVDQATGAMYMVFANDVDGSGWNHVMLTKSTDGGKNWTVPQRVDVGTPANTHSFNGTVEVTADGTVAVMYYDFRNNTAAPGLPTDIFLAHSHDGGATWTEQHVQGGFDMENAPNALGWFLGDYQGMAAAGNDLILFYSVSTGLATARM